MKRYVVHNPASASILSGEVAGRCLWMRLRTPGSPVLSFRSRARADDRIRDIVLPEGAAHRLRAVEVQVEEGCEVTVGDCLLAGLEPWLPESADEVSLHDHLAGLP